MPSTVGAGDAALAGYILAIRRGSAPERLQMAAAYGSAAAALPGSTPPDPGQLNLDGVELTALAET